MALDQHRLDVVANNLANVNTVGYKQDRSVFMERLSAAQASIADRRYQPSALREMSGGAFVADVHTDLSPGQIEPTSRSLDVALNGSGMLCVRDGEDTHYTRDGRMALADGKLVRAIDGKSILDDQGHEIELGDVAADEISIGQAGEIYRQGQLVTTLGIVEFQTPNALTKIGGNLFASPETPNAANETTVISEAIELSGVNPSNELVQMIKTSRNFEINGKMISIQDQTLSRLLSDLPKL